MAGVTDLLALSEARLVVMVLALARVAGLFLMGPIFASRATPLRVRAALAFFITLAMMPVLAAVPAPSTAEMGALVLAAMLAFETAIGFTVGLVAGLIVAVFQALTQIHEMTLTFIPKIGATILALALFGPWMLQKMLNYTTALFESVPGLVR